MAKKRWTREELKEIWARGIKCFPPPKEGEKYGCSDKFLPICVNNLKVKNKFKDADPWYRTHDHRMDVSLLWGGCHGKDTPILMYDGSIKMVQDVVVGDQLMGPDSTPRSVLELCRGMGQMYKVNPIRGGDSFICNDDHILSLRTSGLPIGGGKYSTGDVMNISIKEYLTKYDKAHQQNLKLYKANVTSYKDSQDTLPIDPYFLGLWLGDGHHRGTAVTTMDNEIVDYLHEYAESLGMSVTKEDMPNNRASNYNIVKKERHTNRLKDLLRQENLLFNKHIPDKYLLSTEENRLKLLAGLIDSDGSRRGDFAFDFSQNKKRERLVKQVEFLCRSLGFICKINEKIDSRKRYKTIKGDRVDCRLNIAGDISKVPVKIARKKSIYRKKGRDTSSIGFTIEKLNIDNYYGFKLDKDNLYLLGDFTVTHNTGSGKTCHSVALGMEYTFGYPGAKGLIGGKVYKDLYQNVIVQYRDLLTINEYWDHPAVKAHPSVDGHNKILTIEPYPGAKWSEIEFFQFAEWERVRGRNRDWIHFEEISQLDDESIIDELPRRLRGLLLPVSPVICTTNPPISTTHWIYPKWNVYQHKKGYDGEKTAIGKPCTCQYCQVCINKKLGTFEYDENHLCTNPNCPEIARKGSPKKREFYEIQGVKTYCPGNQHFWRVIFSSAVDNAHVRDDYIQSQSNSDSRVNSLFVEGEPMELNASTIYDSFSYLNVKDESKVTYDPTKDIFWTFDFNNRPQCSAICQENYKEDGKLDYVLQIDEIILYDIKDCVEVANEFGEFERGAGPEHVAATFMERYPVDQVKGTVFLHGDPTAVNKTSGPLEKTKYQIIYNLLTDAGYKVIMTVKKEEGKKRHIPIIDRVNNAKWLFRDNKGTIHFYISSKCKYTIESIKNLKWDKSGEKPDKRLIDEYARRSTEIILPQDVYKVIKLVSHPADALTYYLYQKFPLIKDQDNQVFLTIPGEVTYTLNGDKVTERESELKKKPCFEELTTPNSIMDDIKRSLGDYNEITGEDITFFSSFFS